MTTISEFSTPSDTEIRVVRSFAADLDTVWTAWTQAEHLKNWWAPDGLTTPICEVDLRPGGTWFYVMEDGEGNRYAGKVIYGEIDAPRCFTGVDVFTDEDGNSNDELPTAHTAYEFEEANGETIVSNVTRYDTKEARDQVIEMGVEAGLMSCLAKLDKYLASLG
ncbi:MAG: SRPBCC domain-containing protein [Chloroflexi bacterium]|nr:SRPBCC domain-containing protein [Chloroflexota bacterium]